MEDSEYRPARRDYGGEFSISFSATTISSRIALWTANPTPPGSMRRSRPRETSSIAFSM